MRFRISYKKNSSLRFTSALDVQRIWERTCRRASLNIKYSKGFHPQPRIQLGIPLPLGFMSLDEKVDIWIEDSLSLEEISVRLEQNGLLLRGTGHARFFRAHRTGKIAWGHRDSFRGSHTIRYVLRRSYKEPIPGKPRVYRRSFWPRSRCPGTFPP